MSVSHFWFAYLNVWSWRRETDSRLRVNFRLLTQVLETFFVLLMTQTFAMHFTTFCDQVKSRRRKIDDFWRVFCIRLLFHSATKPYGMDVR